jgi:chitin synthase
MASTSDINHPPSNGGLDSSTSESSPSAPYSARQRHDSNGPLVLPAPLSSTRILASAASASSVGMSRSSEEITYASDMGSISNQRLVSSPSDQYNDVYSESPAPHYPQFDAQVARTAGTNGGVIRNTTLSSHPGETQNPFRASEAQAVAYDDQYGGYSTEPEEMPPHIPNRRQSRGVSLSDNGPVPGPDGVRRVAKPTSRRPTSQAPQNRYSRSSTAHTLPPGAAPPQPGTGYGGGY